MARRREGLVGNVNRRRSWGLGSVQIEDPGSWNGVKRREGRWQVVERGRGLGNGLDVKNKEQGA